MTDPPVAPKNLSLSWRNPRVRELVYQVLILAAVVWAAVFIFQNTVSNLTRRGISSGFSYLANEAGFRISEVVPIPRLDAPFLVLMAVVCAGALATYALHRVLDARGLAMGEDYRLILAGLFLLVGLPVLAFYALKNGISTITYNETHSYGLALATGVFNTLKVSVLACLLATAIGFTIGIARLSGNWLISRLAGAYIEVVRNVPLLLQLFFWYIGVLGALPVVENSLRGWGGVILNVRGLYLPEPVQAAGLHPFLLALGGSLAGLFFWLRLTRLIRENRGAPPPVVEIAALILVGPSAVAWLVWGAPFTFAYPVQERFNFVGGIFLTSSFAALLLGLSIYHAAFIAEVVRSGIQAVSQGQKEAGKALGLSRGQVMGLVVIPQALRVIIPPLTSQYLNTIKNSSLGLGVGYMELKGIAEIATNQSGQAIENISIMMAIYLAFSLLTSFFMNWYNARVALVER